MLGELRRRAPHGADDGDHRRQWRYSPGDFRMWGDVTKLVELSTVELAFAAVRGNSQA
jgi:hypothetical protein